MELLKIKDLSIFYEDTCVINSANLSLLKGQCIGLIGASGSGKSTIFNTLAGFIKPSFGQIFYKGEQIHPEPGFFGYMLQNDLLLPYKSALENVAMVALFSKHNKQQSLNLAFNYLSKLNIEHLANRYPAELSGGQRQRVAFARTMLFKSELFLLDEPFAALDALSKTQLQNWLKEHLKANNLSAILITHDINEAIKICDEIYILLPQQNGSVLKKVTKDENQILNLLGIN